MQSCHQLPCLAPGLVGSVFSTILKQSESSCDLPEAVQDLLPQVTPSTHHQVCPNHLLLGPKMKPASWKGHPSSQQRHGTTSTSTVPSGWNTNVIKPKQSFTTHVLTISMLQKVVGATSFHIFMPLSINHNQCRTADSS